MYEDKLTYAVSNLRSWSDKILTEIGTKRRRLDAFIVDFNIRDYMQFYLELHPHLEQCAVAEPERYSSLIAAYRENHAALVEAMTERAFTKAFADLAFGLKLMPRMADDLVETLRQVKLNTENWEYAMRLDG